MPGEPTLLRTLITARHWQRFETFAVQFERAAGKLAVEDGEPGLAKVSVSVRQFERWYGGKVRTSPHPDSCRILEHMFGYPVQQLLAPATRLSHEISLTRGEDESRPAATRTLQPGPIWPPGAFVPGDFRVTEDSALPDPERILAMAARRAMRFSATAGSSNIAGESIDQLWAETSRLAIAYLQQPLTAITGDIVSLQDIVFSLLEGRQRPRESRDLYVIGGLASGMLSKASHDLRDPDLAMTHARTALLCANNAEHPSLTSWVRGLQSLVTFWAQRPRESLEYAQLGQQVQGTAGSVSVWLASLEARAWAILGNGSASRQAIARAADLRERLVSDDLDRLGGMCYFSLPRQLYYASDAGAVLPEHDESGLRSETESLAAEAVTAYEQAPENEKSFGDEAGSRTDLAVARARAGNLEGASEAIQPVLELPVAQRIHGVVTSVLNVHRAVTVLSPDAPAARDIQEQIENYCRTPAAALPR
jgi:hypothetical protein